jgi:hypothetical protein
MLQFTPQPYKNENINHGNDACYLPAKKQQTTTKPSPLGGAGGGLREKEISTNLRQQAQQVTRPYFERRMGTQ